MNNEPTDAKEREQPLFQRLRNTMFPISPADTAAVKVLKTGGFYLFAIMALTVSLTLMGVIMFVL